MTNELSLRASLAVILILFFAVRIYYTALAARSGKTLSMSQLGRVRGFLMLVVGWVTIILPIVYVVAPGWLAWAVLPLPLVGGGSESDWGCSVFLCCFGLIDPLARTSPCRE